MNHDLYKTIEELKETLSSIDSARKQVSDTVSAYAKTQTGIENYVEKLSGIEEGMEDLINRLVENESAIEQQSSSALDDLRRACQEITDKTQTTHESIVKTFTEKLNERLTRMEDSVTAFDDTITKTEGIATKLYSDLTDKSKATQEAIAQSFSESVNAKLEEMDRQISTFAEAVKHLETLGDGFRKTSDDVVSNVKTIETIRQELATSQQEQDTVLSHIEGKTTTLAKASEAQLKLLISDMSKSSASLQESLDKAKSEQVSHRQAIEKSIQELRADSTRAQIDLESKVGTNRVISVATLVLLVVLLVLQFVI